MKILITGASGFVGAHLIRVLSRDSQKDNQIFGTYQLHENIDCLRHQFPKVKWYDLDLTSPSTFEKIISLIDPNIIFHLAAMAFVPDCEKKPEHAFQINVQSFDMLTKSCAKLRQRPRIITISTSQVYDTGEGMINAPLTETAKIKPINVYARTKLEMEQKALMMDLDIIIMRPFNHIGPKQSESFVVSNFAKQIAEIELGLREPMIQVGDLRPKRDFTDVRDIARAYKMAALDGEPGEIYNVCSGISLSIREILDGLCGFSKKPVKIVEDIKRFRKNEIPILVGSCEKFYQQTGWKPEIPIHQTLKDIYQDWIKRLS